MSDDIAGLTKRLADTHAWRGSAKIDRRSVLASQGLDVTAKSNNRILPWDGIATVIIGVLIFFVTVIGFSIVWPSHRACAELVNTIGLRGDQTVASCTWENVRDSLRWSQH